MNEDRSVGQGHVVRVSRSQKQVWTGPLPPSGSLTYRLGDATSPERDGRPVILAHVVNDRGAFGAGFALAVAKRWPHVRNAYSGWHAGTLPQEEGDGMHGPYGPQAFELGNVLMVRVADGLWVANMLSQVGLRSLQNRHPLRYPALRVALSYVGMQAEWNNAVVVMPRIGCGLAGGEWSEVEPLIRRNLCDAGVDVVVYDLNERDAARYAA